MYFIKYLYHFHKDKYLFFLYFHAKISKNGEFYMKYFLLIVLFFSFSCSKIINKKDLNYETASEDLIKDAIKNKLEYYGTYGENFSEDNYVLQDHSYYTLEEKRIYNFKTKDIIPYWCYLNNPNFKVSHFKKLQVNLKDSIRRKSLDQYKNKCNITKSLQDIISKEYIITDDNLISIMENHIKENKEEWKKYFIKNFNQKIYFNLSLRESFYNRYHDTKWINIFFDGFYFKEKRTILKKMKKKNLYLYTTLKDNLINYSQHHEKEALIEFYQDKSLNHTSKDYLNAYMFVLKTLKTTTIISFAKKTNSYSSLISFLFNEDIDKEKAIEIMNKIPNNKLGTKNKDNLSLFHVAGKFGNYKLIRKLKSFGIKDNYNSENLKGFDIALQNKYYSVAKEINEEKYFALARFIKN
jgi:hypothetical protein